jgi:hypothetical protein
MAEGSVGPLLAVLMSVGPTSLFRRTTLLGVEVVPV